MVKDFVLKKGRQELANLADDLSTGGVNESDPGNALSGLEVFLEVVFRVVFVRLLFAL